jgi:hypothetical protein
MAQTNIDKVKDLIVNDAGLQQRLQSAQGESALMSTLIGIGQEKGLPFTEAEVNAWKAQQRASEELSDDQLKSVAGGAVSYGSSILCGFCGSQSGTFVRSKRTS